RLARTPAALVRLSPRTLERAIYPVGFYRTKARTLRAVARVLLERHAGRVPADLDGLLALPGVGRKTANLVLTDAFGLPGICVDTHVHRITNRWGYVATRTPAATEMALRAKLPAGEWRGLNTLLVAFGQTICRPLSPHCSICALDPMCPRRGVGQVAVDQSTQPVPHEVYLRRNRGEAHGLNHTAEPAGETLVVEAGWIGEAHEVPDAAAGEMTAQREEVGRVAEEAVHQDDGGR